MIAGVFNDREARVALVVRGPGGAEHREQGGFFVPTCNP